MFITYKDWRPSAESEAQVEQANSIISEYRAQGYTLTLRQLYYQFVARALIPNTLRSYKNLGSMLVKARMAGMVSWTAIEDRTRGLSSWRTFDCVPDAIQDALDGYVQEKWTHQPNYCEVWVEKEALAGVVEDVCGRLEVPFFSCRGYGSQSEMWVAARRFRAMRTPVTVIHLGDHDPSGIDMTRDIEDRLAAFGVSVTVERIALNWDQIEEFQPPPNPAKMSDSRAPGYVEEFGYESWELDALEPAELARLIEGAVAPLRDDDAWAEAVAEQERNRETLKLISENADEVADFVRNL